jgi:hypothetical protein
MSKLSETLSALFSVSENNARLIQAHRDNVNARVEAVSKATSQVEADSHLRSAETSFNRANVKEKYLAKPELQGALSHIIRSEEEADSLYFHQDKKASYLAQTLFTRSVQHHTETREMLPLIFARIESESEIAGHKLIFASLPPRLRVNPFRSFLTTMCKVGLLTQHFEGNKTSAFEVTDDYRNVTLWKIVKGIQ